MAGMDANTVYTQALEFGAQRKVVKSEMDVPERCLRLALDFLAGTKFSCPSCGAQQRRSQLIATSHALGRAVVSRELLQDALASREQAELEGRCAWAERSCLAALRDLARTLKRHRDGVLAYMETKLNNGVMGAVNGLL